MSTLRYRIGGFSLALRQGEGERYAAGSPALDAFADHAPAQTPADLEIEARAGALPELRQAQRTFERGRFWEAYRCGDRQLFACVGTAEHAGAWRVLEADAQARRWRIITTPLPSFLTAGQALPNPLAFPAAELMLLTHCATRSSAIMHACGVVDPVDSGNGARGYLFCGRSGAGKSTTAALWSRAAIVLNDDRVLVRRLARGSFEIHGTPWHGDFARADPRCAPLHGVFFLEHAAEHRVQPITPCDAHRRLLASCWLPVWDRSDGLAQTLALCAQLARELPAFQLAFRRDRGMLDVVRHALRDELKGS